MKVLNLFGGPGSGKSTTAFGLAYKMKLRHMKTELVTEYAKELVYAGRLEQMLNQQEYIFTEQNRRLHDLRGKVDWAICDSPIMLSCVYPKMNQTQKGVDEWPALEDFMRFVFSVFNTYENVNVFINRPNTFQTYGREHSEEQSQEIDNEIRRVLAAYGVGYYYITADGESTVDHIIEKVIIPNSED